MEKTLSTIETPEILAALHWQLEMGADEPIEDIAYGQWHEEPITETPPARLISSSNQPSQPSAPSENISVPTSVAAAINEARRLADSAQTLAELTLVIQGFEGCALKKTAFQTVIADGVAHSPIMLIGEAPGAEEDKQGVPFCGASGQLLDTMLGYAGLSRKENLFISNCVYWRPPGNRQPTPEEIAICQPFVEKMIALNAPKILVAVGGTATKALLNESRGITKIRGQVFEYKNQYLSKPLPIHVIYHPSFLLRQPMAKKDSWNDILSLKSALQALS